MLIALYAWYLISWRFQKHPDLRRGYIVLFLAWIFWINVSSLTHFLAFEDFKELPAYVFNWMGSIVLAVWILFLKGGNVLEKYPGLPFVPVGRAARIRIYVVLLLTAITLPSLLEHDSWMSENPFTPAFPFAFAGLWIFVSYLLSIFNGWQWLSESYRFREKFVGKKFRWQSGTLGFISARNCLTLGANTEGLYLAMNILFRVGHPPLFIPWSDIEVGRRRFSFFSSVVFEFAQAPGVLFVLSEKRAIELSDSCVSITPGPLLRLFSDTSELRAGEQKMRGQD